MTRRQHRHRNVNLVLWLVCGLLGAALSPRQDVFALGYVVGTALVLVVRRGRFL